MDSIESARAAYRKARDAERDAADRYFDGSGTLSEYDAASADANAAMDRLTAARKAAA